MLSLLWAEPVELPVTVIGDRVNLRNAASLDSQVISSANYGDEMIAVEMKDSWIRLSPPESLEVWVYGRLLFADREVRAPVLNLRAGPGTNHPSLGQIQRGAPVKVVESRGDWRRIVAPLETQVWMSKEFAHPKGGSWPGGEALPEPTPPPSLEATPTPTQEPTLEATEDPIPLATPEAGEQSGGEGTQVPEVLSTPTPVATPVLEVQATPLPTLAPTAVPTPLPTPEATPAPTKVEVIEVERVIEVEVIPTPTPTVKAPKQLNLVPLDGQGTRSVRRGRLKVYLIAGSAPSRFQLVTDDEEERRLAYLLGDDERLKTLNDLVIQVRGRDFWVAGQRIPVTRVERVTVLKSEAP